MFVQHTQSTMYSTACMHHLLKSAEQADQHQNIIQWCLVMIRKCYYGRLHDYIPCCDYRVIIGYCHL